MKKLILPTLLILIVNGCISVAKLSDFSQTFTSIDFDKLSKDFKLPDSPLWTFDSADNEYFIEKAIEIEENKLVELIKKSLDANNYSIQVLNTNEKCIIGKRGLVANEWKSITAVYYKISTNKIQVYLKTKITQDFTGGFSENRAKKVGLQIEKALK